MGPKRTATDSSTNSDPLVMVYDIDTKTLTRRKRSEIDGKCATYLLVDDTAAVNNTAVLLYKVEVKSWQRNVNIHSFPRPLDSGGPMTIPMTNARVNIPIREFLKKNILGKETHILVV